MLFYLFGFIRDNLEFGEVLEKEFVKLLVIEDGHLISHAEAPEQAGDGQVNLAIVNDSLGYDGAT